jgi:hypothetical protein
MATTIDQIIDGRPRTTTANRGFAPGGCGKNLKRMEILNIFMDGLTRQAYLKPARCKAPERYAQAEKRQRHSKLTMKMEY